MKKLLLMIVLSIPMMGYCGFIDWIQGYPDVKAKIEKALEQKYHGDKFEVSNVSYSDNLGGYNFDAKDITRDLSSKGSYFDKSKTLMDSFGWSMNWAVWGDLFKPYTDKFGSNTVVYPSVGIDLPVVPKKYKKTITVKTGYNSSYKIDDYSFLGEEYGPKYTQVGPYSKAMAEIYGKNAKLTFKSPEFIKKYHQFIGSGITMMVDAPKTPEGIAKVLQNIYLLDQYTKSLHLFSYGIGVSIYDFPEGFDLKQYLAKKRQEKNYYESDTDKGIQQYAWGYIHISSCPKNPDFDKICNTYYDNKHRERLIKERSTADRVNNVKDLAQYLRVLNPGYKAERYNYDTYIIQGRAYKLLPNTKYWPQVKKILNTQGDK
ncbi:hypothetical protein [Francisella sp. SYW-9]|uniref:hypothetical protein n=1 Tax=Francisella sp. SYW-9 TaxID=2610888 RepID=UPI00123D3D5B|nr:hypothetical protein [Francisella sp. SYW-9]